MRLRLRLCLALLTIAVSACGGAGGGPIPPVGGSNGVGVFDEASAQCTVSYDGLIWYTVPSGIFSPIDVQKEQCAAQTLSAHPTPPIPSWAHAPGATKAVFVAGSLQENYVPGNMQIVESVAAAHHVPMTWLMSNAAQYLATPSQIAQYGAEHAANGDDVQAAQHDVQNVESALSWYVPSVSVELGGRGHLERNPAAAMQQFGEHAFWGITWDTLGIDGIDDQGAPWGTYCADPSSYKRPAPDGSCDLLAFEWTARDLDRAYYSGQVAAFSTDPDDLFVRGGFSLAGAQTYVQQLVDAYAAAGETQPLVMISQQETAEASNQGDAQVLDAMYAQAVADKFTIETFAQAAATARTFSAQPRAVAFPYIAGGKTMPSSLLGGVTLYPPAIDYHDTVAGMTFVGGRTLPSRVFRYADYPVSQDALPMPAVPASQLPSLTAVAVSGGKLVFHFDAPVALHYGVAIWSDPAGLGLSGPGVVPAGHAGAVLVFDLQSGPNDVSFPCSGCTSTTFSYSV